MSKKRKGPRPPKPEGAVLRNSERRRPRSQNDTAKLAEWLRPVIEPLQANGLAFLHPETDATVLVITVSELISWMLEVLIILHVGRPPTNADLDKVFKNNGPLSTFSSRIDLCYLMGYIIPDAKHDLDIMRKVRNEFCHSVVAKNFDDPKIKVECAKLRAYDLGDSGLTAPLVAVINNQKGEARQKYVASTTRVFTVLLVMLMKRLGEVEVLSLHRDDVSRRMREKSTEHLSFMLHVPDDKVEVEGEGEVTEFAR